MVSTQTFMALFSSLAPIFLFYLPLVLAGGSVLYHLAVAFASLRFHREKEHAGAFAPAVSILKPLRGIEQNFYATLRTFFEQDYPTYEIVFGLSDPKDPASWTIAQLRREFPKVPVKIVIIPDAVASNPKMNKLQQMVAEASHDVLVITDADIRVAPDYLRRVVQPLANERVGLVTCLYRGVPVGKLGSVLEALGMSGDFAGQVLLARALRGVRFGLGATLATRKRQIAEIGGLAPWADYLADDYILGSKIAEAGYTVHLSHTVVETLLPHRTLSETFHQQLRWARTIRACSPRGYLGLLFAYAAPLAILPAVTDPKSALALKVLGGALVARFLGTWAAGVLVCQDKVVRNYFWLLPVRDLLALVIWLLSFFGSEIVWRQARFRLEADGKIKAVTSDP